MTDELKQFNFNFNHELAIAIAIIVLGGLLSILILRNPDSELISISISSLISFILGLAINPTKKQ